MSSSPADWAQTGVLGAAVAIITLSGLKGLWLFRWTHDAIVAQLQKDLDRIETEAGEWKDLALSQVGIVRQTVDRTAEVVYRSTNLRTQALEEQVQTIRREHSDGRDRS